MAVYSPLFVYLTPASIPQVVSHIQKYLADNPIVSDPEAIAEVIQQYIEDHPEIIAVASVNGETGNVVLTGSDININASSAVSVETQLLNLASMISNAGANITQIEANISQIYTTVGTLQTNVETNASNISALQTSVTGQGTRLAAAEGDIDLLESAQSAQNTRLNTAEGNISSLQTRMTNAETDIDSNESNIETLNTAIQTTQNNITSLQNSSTIKSGDHLTVATDTSLVVPGILTGSTKMLVMSIYLGKKITATGINILTFKAIVRGVIGYIEGSLVQSDFLSSEYTFSHKDIVNADNGIITFNVTKSTAFPNATNNTPVSLEIYGGNLDIEFT